MMIVECLECGKKQQWRNGMKTGEMQIECSVFLVSCSCGHAIHEENGVLQEYQTDYYVIEPKFIKIDHRDNRSPH